MTDEIANRKSSIENFMSQWVINGLRTGIKTTVYPRDQE